MFGRQDEGELETESFHPDSIEKLLQKSSEDPSLSDWHQGFHIYLVSFLFHNLIFPFLGMDFSLFDSISI